MPRSCVCHPHALRLGLRGPHIWVSYSCISQRPSCSTLCAAHVPSPLQLCPRWALFACPISGRPWVSFPLPRHKHVPSPCHADGAGIVALVISLCPATEPSTEPHAACTLSQQVLGPQWLCWPSHITEWALSPHLPKVTLEALMPPPGLAFLSSLQPNGLAHTPALAAGTRS